MFIYVNFMNTEELISLIFALNGSLIFENEEVVIAKYDTDIFIFYAVIPKGYRIYYEIIIRKETGKMRLVYWDYSKAESFIEMAEATPSKDLRKIVEKYIPLISIEFL